MNYLIQGQESAERFALLVSLTKVSSENVISALRDYLVTGLDAQDCASLNAVPQPNFNRALKRLNEVAGTVEEIKDHDWARFIKSNR